LRTPNKDKTYEPALACLQSLFMITIRDHGSSQLIRPEDTASGLVMAQSAEEPVAKEDRAQGGFSTFRTSEEAVGDLWSREPRTATCNHLTPTGYGKSLTIGEGGFATSRNSKEAECFGGLWSREP
jgi:hypothetical protein